MLSNSIGGLAVRNPKQKLRRVKGVSRSGVRRAERYVAQAKSLGRIGRPGRFTPVLEVEVI